MFYYATDNFKPTATRVGDSDGKLNSKDIIDLDDRDERSDAIWRRYPTNLNGPLTVDFVNGIAFRVLY